MNLLLNEEEIKAIIRKRFGNFNGMEAYIPLLQDAAKAQLSRLQELVGDEEKLESLLVGAYMKKNGWMMPVGDDDPGDYDIAVETVKWFLSLLSPLIAARVETKAREERQSFVLEFMHDYTVMPYGDFREKYHLETLKKESER